MLSRTDARAVQCPACGARANDPCIGTRGKVREANHAERVNATTRAHNLRSLRVLTVPSLHGWRTLVSAIRVLRPLKGPRTRTRTHAHEGQAPHPDEIPRLPQSIFHLEREDR